MEQQSKVMSAAVAIEQFVHNGDCLAGGGFVTNRRPYALVREIILILKEALQEEILIC